MKFSILPLVCASMLFSSLSNGQDANEVRKWTSSDGSRTFEGKVVKYTGKKVTIARPGETPKTFLVELFSEEDKKWMEENKDELKKAAPETKGNTSGNLVSKQFGDMTYAMNPKAGLTGATKLSWGKKPVKNTAKYYILLYTASWCPFCVEEMPKNVKLYNESIAADPDIDLILCSSDHNAKGMKKWADDEKISFPILPKDKLKKVALAQELSPRGIPSAFLVEAATGKVVHKGLPPFAYAAYLKLKK